jgi:hypothetical protein
VKAYTHNGYFKSLKAFGHFDTTRDTLNGGMHKPAGEPGEGITYRPFPEVNQNLDQTIGHLGLTDTEENQIVLFLQTLTDGYFIPPVQFNDVLVPAATAISEGGLACCIAFILEEPNREGSFTEKAKRDALLTKSQDCTETIRLPCSASASSTSIQLVSDRGS